MKSRLQELLKQLDIYQNQVSSSKDSDLKDLRRELDSLKKEKERLVDRNSELALALKDVTEDYRQQREESDRLREKLSSFDR